MRKIEYISNIGNSISITFSDGESAVFYPFGKTIYTQTSPGLLKKTLTNFKKDILKSKWNVEHIDSSKEVHIYKLFIYQYLTSTGVVDELGGLGLSLLQVLHFE